MHWRSAATSRCRAVLTAALIAIASREAHGERLPIRVYTTADGLSQNQIVRIVRDSRGFLWFCTREGLSRFDGQTFVSYTQREGLPHRSVRDIVEARDGEYWIATRLGLVHWKPSVVASSRGGGVHAAEKHDPAFEVFSLADSDAGRDVWRLFRDPTGTIWVGTVAGLFRIESDGGAVRFRSVDIGMPNTAPDTRLVQDIQMDATGALWVGTRASGIFRRMPDGRIERYTRHDGLPEDRVNALLLDHEGHVWAGTSLGLARLDPARSGSHSFAVTRVYTKQSGLAGDWIDALFERADSSVWIGVAGGLSTIIARNTATEQIRAYGGAQGVSDYEVTTLVDDRSGNLWAGTGSHGALRLARDGMTQYGDADGIGTPVVGALFSDSRAGAVCVYDYKRLAIFDGRRFVNVPINFGKPVRPSPSSWGRTALRDRSGAFWFATENGLYRFPSVHRIEDLSQVRPVAIYDAHHGLTADRVLMVYEDRRGDIWIFSDGGWQPILTRWERATGQFHQLAKTEAWPVNVISDIGEDHDGNLWIAESTLVRYRDGRFRQFTKGDGLSSDSVSSLYFDRQGRLWLTTDTAGVMRIDNPSADRLIVRSYSTNTGLGSDQTFSITEDKAGRIYIVTGRGVDRLDVGTGAIHHYTSAEGLFFGPLTLRDADGGLWFGAANGLSRLVPTRDIERAPPSAWISKVRVEGLPRPIPDLGTADAGTLSLSSADRQVSVDFFGIGEGLQYQYRLVGSGDSKWSVPVDQHTVHYPSLSSGHYQFEVRAVSGDSGLKSSPATVAFTIPPPIWLRWWFIALSLATIALALYGLHRRRVAHLVEVERVRTRIATDLHDDLGANLSRVAILSEVVKQRVGESDAESVSLLMEIADSSRSLMGSLRDLVWAIDPGGGAAGDVETRVRQIAGTLLDPKGITWTLRGSDGDSRPSLDAEQRRHVVLFFKEGLNNAARYASASHVDLSIEQRRDAILCRIIDDGCGFDTATASARDGRGLRNMQARANALGGRMDVLSRPGGGTTLTLTIPFARRAVGA